MGEKTETEKCEEILEKLDIKVVFNKKENNIEDYCNEIINLGEIVDKARTKEIAKLDVCNQMMDVIARDCIKILEYDKKIKNKDDLKEELKKDIGSNPQIDFLKNWIDYDDVKAENIVCRRAIEDIGAHRIWYDPDASLVSSYILGKVFQSKKFEKSEKIKIEKFKSYRYKICCCDEKYKYRGDTMNSWHITLHKYMKCFGKDYTNNYKDSLPDYINNFMKYVYTIGNFTLVLGPGEPVDFNRRRSRKFNDYWDLTLLEIYEYYMDKSKGKWIRELEGKSSESKEAIKNWLNRLDNKDEDQDGWDRFVKQNFMQPFVERRKKNQYGRPYELWDGHFEDWGLPEEEWQFEQFFRRAAERILARGELIAEELIKDNLKRDS